MAGVVDGNLNHTQSSRHIDYIKVNGQPVGEIAQFALYVGAMGLPVIYLSGDEAACREARETIAGITTTAVKRGLSRDSAVSLSAVEARRRIRKDIKSAIDKHLKTPLAPLAWKGPFTVEKRYFHTDSADNYAGQEDVERVDSQTVRFTSEDIRKVIYR